MRTKGFSLDAAGITDVAVTAAAVDAVRGLLRLRIVRDTRYSGTLGCANLKVSQVPEVARAAEKRIVALLRGREETRKRRRKKGKRKNSRSGEEECGGCMLIVLHQVLW